MASSHSSQGAALTRAQASSFVPSSRPDEVYSPFLSLSRFPSLCLPDHLIQPVLDSFFDKSKFYNRTWTIWFLHNEEKGNDKLFIPQSEFIMLLKEIHDKFPEVDAENLELYWTRFLLVEIPTTNHLWYTPQLLGVSQSEEEFKKLLGDLSHLATIFKQEKTLPNPSDDQRAEFESFWKDLEESEKPHAQDFKTIRKEKRKAEQKKKQQQELHESDQHLKRAQQYLGLRKGLVTCSLNQDLSSGNNSNIKVKPELFINPPRVDHQDKAPLPFFEDSILIAIDLEAFWRNPHMITEVGLAVLDTRVIKDIAPGEFPLGRNWHIHIHSRHIKPSENINLSNEEINMGNSDDFKFGDSEVYSMTVVCNHLQQVFSTTDSKDSSRLRNIILIGHDIKQDIKFLDNVLFDPYESGTVIDTIDTQRMYHSILGGAVDSRHPNLARLLRRLQIDCLDLHNAGNDAVYTLQAFLAMALLEATRRPNAVTG